MTTLDPFIPSLPERLRQDRELAEYFRYLHLTIENLTSRAIEDRLDVNATTAAMDAVLQKLDADAGVTDTDYESTHGQGGSGAALPDTRDTP